MSPVERIREWLRLPSNRVGTAVSILVLVSAYLVQAVVFWAHPVLRYFLITASVMSGLALLLVVARFVARLIVKLRGTNYEG